MNRGKAICETLKQLRIDIAKANDIEYHPTTCTHKGPCSGTCPKCEEELAYLTAEIEKRQAAGIEPNFEGYFTLKNDATTLMTEYENTKDHDRHLTGDIRGTKEEFVLEGAPRPIEEWKIFNEPPTPGIVLSPEQEYNLKAERLYQNRLSEIGLNISVSYFKLEWISFEDMRTFIDPLGDEKQSPNATYQMIRKGIFLGYMKLMQPLKTSISAAELNEFIGKREQFFSVLLRKTALVNDENLRHLSKDLFENCFLKATHKKKWDIEALIETDLTIAFNIGYELVKSK